jgi:LacI family transcriptional regulator
LQDSIYPAFTSSLLYLCVGFGLIAKPRQALRSLSRQAGSIQRMTPTIKDVARAAGVHYATVSRALRGMQHTAAMQERVRLAADRLGYMRNPTYLALSGRRWAAAASLKPERIAIVSNRSPEEGFYKLFPHYRLLSKGVIKRAGELGYQCDLLFVDKGHYNSKTLYRYLKRAGIRGLIFAALEPERDWVGLPWEEFCAVKIDSQDSLPKFTFISVDQFHYTQLSFRKMRELGYKRIGMMVGAKDEKATGDLHTAAYLLEQAAIPERDRVEPFYLELGLDTPKAIKAMKPWLQQERPDAVISNWTQIWQLVRPFTQANGMPVATAAMCMPFHARFLAGIVGDLRQVGERATTLLVGLLQTGQYGVPKIQTSTYIKGAWHDGATAPPCTPSTGGMRRHSSFSTEAEQER